MRDISYGEIKNWLTVHDKERSIALVSDGLGLLAILPVVGLGVKPAVLAVAADLLAIRTEPQTTVTKLLSWFNRGANESPCDRIQRMRVAYGLLTCSAFFEAVQRRMPEAMTSFQVTKDDRTRLVNAALAQLQAKPERNEAGLTGDLWSQSLLPFPHPTDDWDQQQRESSELFEALAVGLAAFLPCLAHWDELGEAERAARLAQCRTLPKEALSCFEAQYTALSADCHEFRVWARRQEYVAGQRRLDFGMQQLEETINSLYGTFRSREGEDISAALREWYSTQFTKPILREREIAGDLLPPGVTLPPKAAAFIPQTFKVVRYEPGTPIGSEELWNKLPNRQDLPDFLWGYIHSPYSELHPLVVLGHPGSGKSLLTEVFAARLSASPFTPIRIVLRDVTANARIKQQINEQLAADVGSEGLWDQLRTYLPAHPAVLIFDGYDELLQVSGHLFANYIVDIEEFQHDERDRWRTGIRAIITSRSTLIEKARIPKGTTVLRLLGFDEEQQTKWVDTWNAVNVDGFRDRNIVPFSIPKNRAILDLAEQPLLLLMLAIYDSYGNPLSKRQDFSRVSLYSELVSLFIHRECNKDQRFRNLPDDQQATALDRQRRRLGVCALGMFNRATLSLTHRDLEDELLQFDFAPLAGGSTKGLGDSDSLFGGFFFIHRAQARESDGASPPARMIAYEFLHNTFGEYLCADFLLRRVFELAADLTDMKLSPRMGDTGRSYSMIQTN